MKRLMIMRKIALGALGALLASLAAAPAAWAYNELNTNGTICKNYNAGQATVVDYLTSGVRSISPYATSVICPLTRVSPTGYNEQSYVNVGLTHDGTQTTTCTLYAYSGTTGKFLGSKNFSDGALTTPQGFDLMIIDDPLTFGGSIGP